MPYELRDLTDTVVAITGATSGIGVATAELLVERGAKVVVGGRRQDRVAGIAERLGADRCVGVVMDVRNPADNQRLVDAAVNAFGRLDSIVANAGIGLLGSILDYSDEELTVMLDTNIAGTVWSVRAAIPIMLETTGGGDVVMISSVAGLRGGADQAVYSATKFAQVGLADSMDRELRQRGIRVTALCPAAVVTEFAVGSGRDVADERFPDWMTPEDVAFAVRTVLEQPRRVRTTRWAFWSMGQQT